MDFRSEIVKLINIDGVSKEDIYSLLAPTPDIKNGDICLPCFKFSKTMRLSPQLVAEKLKND